MNKFMKMSAGRIGNRLFSMINMISIPISIKFKQRNPACILRKFDLRPKKLTRQVNFNTSKKLTLTF